MRVRSTLFRAVTEARARRTFTIHLLALAALALMARGAAAHGYWLDLSTFTPSPGDTVEVRVCSGHRYPAGDFALKDSVTGELTVTGPGGYVERSRTVRGPVSRRSEFVPRAEGVYLLELPLSRPGLERPAWELRALVICGDGGDDPAAYHTGEGLEIVPLDPLGEARPGGTLRLAVMSGAEPAGFVVEITGEHGDAASYESPAGGPVRMVTGSAGRYMASVSRGAAGCSLVFYVGKEM